MDRSIDPSRLQVLGQSPHYSTGIFDCELHFPGHAKVNTPLRLDPPKHKDKNLYFFGAKQIALKSE